MARFPLRWTLALLLLVTACGGGRAERGGPCHVVLISLDSVRRDAVGFHGGGSPRAPTVAVSPRLDGLAAEGVVLDEAYATTSWTLPSHLALLSGVPDLVHGVDGDHQRPAEDLPWLPAQLREHGWRTAGFYSGPYLAPRFGFDRGFDRYEACYGDELRDAARHLEGLRRRLEAARDEDALLALREAVLAAERDLERASHRDVSGPRVTEAVLSELDAAAASGEPLFLFAHYFDPHYDYAPPEPWDRAFDPEYAGRGEWEDFLRNPRVSVEDVSVPGGRRRVLSDRELENVRARYAGELRGVDGEIGRILDRLDALGIADRTLVIVTSDHGEEFFERGGLGHRRTLGEEVVRVPLVLRHPGALPAGVRRRGPVSLADLAPTVRELCGLPADDATPSASLVPLLRGNDPGAARGVLGRLVTTRPLRIHLEREGASPESVPGRLVQVTETFRRAEIAITRTRTWAEPSAGVAPALAADVVRLHGRGATADELTWIDLAAHPDEPSVHQQTTFTDPRSRAALEAFHDRHVDLRRARRRASPGAAATGDFARLLSGLGYGGGQEPGFDADTVLLDPPGAALLDR